MCVATNKTEGIETIIYCEGWTFDDHDAGCAAIVTEQWVHSWASVPQLASPGNLPPEVFLDEFGIGRKHSASDSVPRLRWATDEASSYGWPGVRPLVVTEVTVALPADGRAGVSAIQADTPRPVTFDGAASVTIPAGAQVVSDPVDGGVALGRTSPSRSGQRAGGRCIAPSGVRARRRTWRRAVVVWAVDVPGAIAVDHWYFLSGLESVRRRGRSSHGG